MNSVLGGTAMPTRVDLDPDYRFPQHRWPDPSRPLPVVNDGRPTDPVVLAEISLLVGAFKERFRAQRGADPRWGDGHSGWPTGPGDGPGQRGRRSGPSM